MKKKEEVTFYGMFRNFNALPDEKKAEIRTIVDEFLKLTHSAARRGIPYRLWMAPSEYLDSLEPLVPLSAALLSETGSIFNESRYSPRLIPRKQIARFKECIKKIIESFPAPEK